MSLRLGRTAARLHHIATGEDVYVFTISRDYMVVHVERSVQFNDGVWIKFSETSSGGGEPDDIQFSED